VVQQQGFQTELDVFEITDGIVTRPGEVTHGCILALGDIDHSEIACSSQAGLVSSISAVRFNPITSLFGNEGGRHHPAVVVFFP
jgi:hypothetical protein